MNASTASAWSAPNSSGVWTTITSPKISVGRFMGDYTVRAKLRCGIRCLSCSLALWETAGVRDSGFCRCRQRLFDITQQLAWAERFGHDRHQPPLAGDVAVRHFKTFGGEHQDVEMRVFGRVANALDQT